MQEALKPLFIIICSLVLFMGLFLASTVIINEYFIDFFNSSLSIKDKISYSAVVSFPIVTIFIFLMYLLYKLILIIKRVVTFRIKQVYILYLKIRLFINKANLRAFILYPIYLLRIFIKSLFVVIFSPILVVVYITDNYFKSNSNQKATT